MKKIVKPKFVAFRTNCHHCGCRFEYEYDDITPQGNVICPCCYRDIRHDAEDSGFKREGEETK